MKLGAIVLVLAALCGGASAQINFQDPTVIAQLQDIVASSAAQGVKGVNNGGLKKMTDLMFDLIENLLRTDLQAGAINNVRNNVMQRFLDNVVFFGNTFDVFLGDGNSIVDQTIIDNQLPLLSLILVGQGGLAKSPNQFCLNDQQCKANRLERFDVSVDRQCLDGGASPDFCDPFVPEFCLIWLTVFIFLVWFIIICWFCYMILIPFCKRKFGKGKAQAKMESGPLSRQDQLMLNTLAAQCATAENLLYRATEVMNYAKRQETVVTVEARREAKLLRVTAQYFQTLAASTVVLAHKYLDKKTQRGERLEGAADDAYVRALQLEILRYVKSRLQLAMDAEPFSEESLLRIAEAYVILKKVMSNVSVVGFDWGDDKDKLRYISTPQPEIDENAFFINGVYSSDERRGAKNLEGREVCVTVEGANTAGIKTNLPADYFMTNARFEVWNFNSEIRAVDKTRGEALVYNFNNAGTVGDTLQHFARQIWRQDIYSIQELAQKDWLKNKDGLERFLERERYELEEAVKPFLKRNKGGRRGRRKGEDDDDVLTQYSDETGYTVNSKGVGRVLHADTVINMGLSVAGQPGIPYDSRGAENTGKRSRWQRFAAVAPNFAEWPKFHFIIFILFPITIAAAMLSKIGLGSTAIDVDGNVDFVARFPAGYGTSFLGVPNYYFLDGFIPPEAELVEADIGGVDAGNVDLQTDVFNAAKIANNAALAFPQNGKVFISNVDAQKNFEDFNGEFGRQPDFHLAEIQAGILSQLNSVELLTVREQQEAQKVFAILIYTFMHIGVFYFAILPLTLCRESWEILARKVSCIRQVIPIALWRDLHMAVGLCMITYVTIGATIYVLMSLIAIGRHTPFSGFAGDPNIADFFDLDANVLYLRMLLLPPLPLLLLMKYADRGPPRFMVKYFPNFITKWYYEMCYFFHFVVAVTATVMLVLYRPQVFYWVGATWGFGYGVNKIIRIVRTKKTTINNAELISYTVEDKRNNGKKKTQVLRLSLNVPKSFPNSSRGQAVWIMAPNIDLIAHPFTIAKVPDVSKNDQTITLHIGIKYMPGDDIISYPKPEAGPSGGKENRMVAAEDGVLPVGWKQAVDPESGRTYYYNSAFQRTTWTRPKETNFRALTTRFSTAMGYRGSTDISGNRVGETNVRGITITRKSTWTQKMAAFTETIKSLDADLRENKLKEYPVYVSAPLGTSFDDVLQPNLPGSVIIVTQNGLPAAEASVRWLLSKRKKDRPKYFYFVSVSRHFNDALTILETLRNSIADAVEARNINIDSIDPVHSHMVDWLGVSINLTQRKGEKIRGDRDVLLSSLNPPKAKISDGQLRVIEEWLKHRVNPGRLAFGRYLKRVQQQVKARTGSDRVAVGYCGSGKVAGGIRAAVRDIDNMTFDGEYI